MSSINDQYKRLRNHLRKTEVVQSLYVLWAYEGWLLPNWNRPMPDDVELCPSLKSAPDTIQRYRQVAPWELEILMRQSLLHASDVAEANTFMKCSYFASAINKLKDVVNEVAKASTSKDPTKIFREIFRISHQQFEWQEAVFSPSEFTRAYKIYNHNKVAKVFESVLGLSPRKLYAISVAASGHFTKNFVAPMPMTSTLNAISQDDVDKFVTLNAASLEDTRCELLKFESIDEDFQYTFNPLKAKPLLIVGDKILCPMRTLLYWRLFSGIYYELVDQPGFDEALGESMEAYVGEVLAAADIERAGYVISPAAKYNKNQKETTDWSISKDGLRILIECKSKRMTLPSKTQMDANNAFRTDLRALSGAIVQTYKTIRDYDNGQLKDLYGEVNRFLPVIVTLESWYLMGDMVWEKLTPILEEEMGKEGIPGDWIDKYPPTITSLRHFEYLSQVVAMRGNEVFEKKVDDKGNRLLDVGAYLKGSYRRELDSHKFLFPDEFSTITEGLMAGE